MTYKYRTSGVCSREIELEVENNIVKSVHFIGGCAGNTQGVAKLSEGLSVDTVINKLKGIRCGFKPTSCPDQLAIALQQIKEKG